MTPTAITPYGEGACRGVDVVSLERGAQAAKDSEQDWNAVALIEGVG